MGNTATQLSYGDGHSYYFPAYRVPRPVYRTCALWTQGRLVTENGELLEATSWGGLKHALFTNNLLGLVQGFAHHPHLRDMVTDESASVLSSGHGVSAVRIRRGREIRWLVSTAAWSVPASIEGVQMIADTIRYLNVGSAATPSGLGLLAMRRNFRGSPISVPPRWLWRTLHDTVVGGRVDTLDMQTRFQTLYETDFTMAYPYAAVKVPAGTIVRFYKHVPDCATYYAKAEVTAIGLKLGPLHAPSSGRSHEYPTDGTWIGWYWKEELEAARMAGCTVRILDGYAWRVWHDGMAAWARLLYSLRQNAPSDDVASIVKIAAVAALGRFGADTRQAELVPAYPGCELYCDPVDGMQGDYGLKYTERPSETNLMHVASYIHAAVRTRLYERAREERERRCLVATNFDALYTTRLPVSPFNASFGGWKTTTLHDARIPAPRWILSAEKERQPGLSR